MPEDTPKPELKETAVIRQRIETVKAKGEEWTNRAKAWFKGMRETAQGATEDHPDAKPRDVLESIAAGDKLVIAEDKAKKEDVSWKTLMGKSSLADDDSEEPELLERQKAEKDTAESEERPVGDKALTEGNEPSAGDLDNLELDNYRTVATTLLNIPMDERQRQLSLFIDACLESRDLAGDRRVLNFLQSQIKHFGSEQD